MGKKIMIVLFSFISTSAFNQTQNTERLIKSIEGQWQLDENANVTYQRIVDSLNLNKTELFNRAMDYFVFSYGDANSVIQNKDIENGIIIGKGLYKSVHFASAILISNTIDTWHILKVELKDSRARITVSLTKFDETVSGGDTPDVHISNPVSTQYPINPKGAKKNLYGQAFYKSHIKAIETLDSVERALKGGVTQKKDNNW